MVTLKTIVGVAVAAALLRQFWLYEFQFMEIGEIPPHVQRELQGLNQTCQEELQWFDSYHRKYLSPGFERYACVVRNNESKGEHPRVEHFFEVITPWLGFEPEVCFYVLSRNFQWEAYGSHEDSAVILNVKGNYTFCHYNFYDVMANHDQHVELISEDPRGAQYFFARESDLRPPPPQAQLRPAAESNSVTTTSSATETNGARGTTASQDWRSSIRRSQTETCATVVEGAYVRHNARHFHHAVGGSSDWNHRIFCEAHNSWVVRANQLWAVLRHSVGAYLTYLTSYNDHGPIQTLDLQFRPVNFAEGQE
eukprot:INCI10693.1.p2 GENE.INCI10693.1~~INCI10693.1.p2  ORF type:complete len:309 (+),score=34.72 INCI10693.1:85-1011(+)